MSDSKTYTVWGYCCAHEDEMGALMATNSTGHKNKDQVMKEVDFSGIPQLPF